MFRQRLVEGCESSQSQQPRTLEMSTAHLTRSWNSEAYIPDDVFLRRVAECAILAVGHRWICVSRKSKLIWPFRTDAQEHSGSCSKTVWLPHARREDHCETPDAGPSWTEYGIVLGQDLVLGGEPAVRHADNNLTAKQDGSSIASAT